MLDVEINESAVPIRGSDRTIDGVLIPLGHRRLMLRVFPLIEKFNLKNEAIGVTSTIVVNQFHLVVALCQRFWKNAPKPCHHDKVTTTSAREIWLTMWAIGGLYINININIKKY